MLQKNVFKAGMSLVGLSLMIACAKADYYERHQGVAGTLSATNDLLMKEGEQKTFVIQLTTPSPRDEEVQWTIKSPTFKVPERFKTPTGRATLLKDQRTLQITISAADVDSLRQGDQNFELEIVGQSGPKTSVPLLLQDVPVSQGQVQEPTRKSSERVLEFDVNKGAATPFVKVLLVMDNSWSMKKKQTQLALGIRSIAKSLVGKNLQFLIYTTSNDRDEDGRYDKRTTTVVKGKRSLHQPYQDESLMIRADMPKEKFDQAVSDLQRNIINVGHIGSKNESALCTLNHILQEKDSRKQVLKKGDTALVFILSDTDDHSKDVPVRDCGGTVSPRKTIAALDQLLGRQNYGVTAVISNKTANKGHECGDLILDEGVQYTSLVQKSPTPKNIFSICSTDYSEALDSVSVFSRKSAMNEFPLKLQAHEEVVKVQILRGGQMITVSEEDFEVRGKTLRVRGELLARADRVRIFVQE